jgi:[protein-PII] uridylyltransferase
MHFLTGRAEDRLSFELQREMAARLGYTSHPGLSAVERFMKHYFLTAKDVGDLTLIFCSKLEEEELITHSGISQIVNRIKLRSRKIKGTKDFVEQNGRINVANDEVFINDPTNLLRVFKIAHKHDYHYHPDLFRLITRSFKLINAKLRKDKKANKIFIDILTSKKDPENTLRRMNESGVLGRFIPAFGKVIAMMQFNMYHHYTVDEHLLRSIGILHEIEQGELEEEHPLANQLMPNIAERKVLYVALLLHDIAKGRPEDHSIEGAKIARKLCPRLGLSREQTALVAWLIEEHLTMSNISQSRDLADRKTITDFAAIVQTMERMKLLLILTICDIKAVGTGVWNGWKGQLLRTLYYETEPQLTGGFSKMSRKERVAMAKEDLMAALFAQDDWSEEEATYWINLQYSAYLLTVATEDQVRHLNFLRASTKAEKKFALGADTKKFEAITELMIMAQDHPKLLSVIAGACTAAGANIADAKIYTTRDGRAFNTIFINRIFESGTDERRRAANIEKLIEGVLKGENKLPDIIAEKARPNKKAAAFSITPVAKIDNTLSEKFTVIEIEGLDRPGLLSEVTHALSSLFLDIASAHIATFGEKVVDSFYVTDLTGAKITSVDRQKSIYKTLISLLKKGQKGNGKAA